MSQTFEEVIRLKLESAGLERADAWVAAFTKLAESGQLTEDQLAELAADFDRLSQELSDTASAQRAIETYRGLAEQQRAVGESLDYAALKWKLAAEAEQGSAALLQERREATAKAKAALDEYAQSADATKAGLRDYKRALAEAKAAEAEAAREHRESTKALREVSREHDAAATAQARHTARMEEMAQVIQGAGAPVDDLVQAQAQLAERSTQAVAGLDRLRDAAQGTVDATRRSAEATREAQASVERLAQAHQMLGTRPFGDIQADIDRVRASYEALSASGTLSVQGLAQAYSRMIDRTTELQAQTNGVLSAFGKVKGAVAAAAVALGGLSSVLSVSSREAGEFSNALGRISTIAESSEMDSLTTGLRALGREFGNVGKQADGAYSLLSAGAKNAAEAMQVLRIANELAIGAVTEVDTAARGIQATLNAFGLGAERAREVSDKFFASAKAGATDVGELADSMGRIAPLAASTGVSLDQLLAAVASLTNGGQSTSEAITALTGVLSAVIKPSGEAATLARELGLEFNTAALRGRNLAGFLQDVAEKTGGSEERLAVLFGRIQGLQGVLALTGKQAGDFASSLKTVADSAGNTADAMEKMRNTPEQVWASFSAAVADLKIELGLLVNSAILPLVQGLTSLVQEFNALEPVTKQWALGLSAGGAVVGVFVSAITKLKGAMALLGGVILDKLKLSEKLTKALLGVRASTDALVVANTGLANSMTAGLIPGLVQVISLLARLAGPVAAIVTVFKTVYWATTAALDKFNDYRVGLSEGLDEISRGWELTRQQALYAQKQYSDFSDVAVLATSDMIEMSRAQRDAYMWQLQGLEKLIAAQANELLAKKQLGQATDEERSRYELLRERLDEVRDAQVRLGESARLLAEEHRRAAESGLTRAALKMSESLQAVSNDADKTREVLASMFEGVDAAGVLALGDVALAISVVGDTATQAGVKLRDGLVAELGNLSGEHLLKFSNSAQAAFEAMGTSAQQAAIVSESVLLTALQRLGLRGEALGISFTQAGRDIIATFRVVAESANASGQQISDAFRAALDGLETQAEIESLRHALETAFEAGRIGAEQFAQASASLQARLAALANAADPLREAFETLGVTSQRALDQAATAAAHAFGQIERAASSGGASISDVRAAFEGYARAQLAAAAQADEGARRQVEAMLRMKGASIGATDALERLGLAGRDAMGRVPDSADRAGGALDRLAKAAGHAGGNLTSMAASARDAGQSMDRLGENADRAGDALGRLGDASQSVSLGEMSEEAGRAYQALNKYAGTDLWSKEVNRLTASINEQRAAWQREVRALDEAGQGNNALAAVMARVRAEYKYLSEEQVRALAEKRMSAERTRADQQAGLEAEREATAELERGNEHLRERNRLRSQQPAQRVDELRIVFDARVQAPSFDLDAITDSQWRRVAEKIIGMIRRDMQ